MRHTAHTKGGAEAEKQYPAPDNRWWSTTSLVPYKIIANEDETHATKKKEAAVTTQKPPTLPRDVQSRPCRMNGARKFL